MTDIEPLTPATALDELMERVVYDAFVAGWRAVSVIASVLSPAEDRIVAYRDWRGYGPGALLPGGDRASRQIRREDHDRQ